MGVIVDQAGKNEGAVQLNDRRFQPAVAAHLSLGPDRQDPVPSHRHASGTRPLGLDCVEVASCQDQVGDDIAIHPGPGPLHSSDHRRHRDRHQHQRIAHGFAPCEGCWLPGREIM